MSYERIQTLLDEHLESLTGLPPLQKENTLEQYKTGRAFCRATMITPRPTRATVGVTGRDRLVGLYQIDLFLPMNTGATTLNALADRLVAHFPRTLALTEDDVMVHVYMSWRETAARAEQFHSASVMVEWACDM